MHSYIITGGTPQDREKSITERLKAWKIHAVDCVSLGAEEEHIGIDAVRLFKKRLQLVPFESAHSVGIIRNCNRLTVEAQNALLKLLEEPPPHAYILCETAAIEALLPTIVSRCEIITIAGTDATVSSKDEIGQTIFSLLGASPGKKLECIDAIAKDRISAKNWTHDAIIVGRQMLLSAVKENKPNEEREVLTRLLRLLSGAQKQLEVNVNPKLVLDTVFLSL
jgi:hypothetical protein